MDERQESGREEETGSTAGRHGDRELTNLDPEPGNGDPGPGNSDPGRGNGDPGLREGDAEPGEGDHGPRNGEVGSGNGDPGPLEGDLGTGNREPEPRRGDSHPENGDGGDTRQRLLQAARKILAEKGFDGTSVRAVTEAAGANLGAVTYHFESKEKLYHAVLEEVLGPMREQAQLLKGLPFSPLQRLEFFIRGMFQHLSENPDMPRFMVQEIVLGSEPAPPILETVRVVAPVLVGIIQEGQHVGTVREGDPVLMALSALSQPIYLSIMPPVLGREDLKTAGVPQPRTLPEDHAVEFVLRGLEARQEESE
ncbi:MAG: TetR family transcriptional regulator [Longimicrobiales bacterium]